MITNVITLMEAMEIEVTTEIIKGEVTKIIIEV